MSVKSITDAIAFMADDHNLQVGQNLPGQLCPSCRGGATKERSFSLGVTHEGIWYKCWRVKCGEKGFISENGTRTVQKTPYAPVQDLNNAHDRDVQDLIDRTVSEGTKKYRIQKFNGRVVGVHFRSANGRTTHIKIGHTAGGFFFPPLSSASARFVVVEDPVSAEAVANAGALAYCLFGTNLSEDKIAEITEAGQGRPIWLCLDKDATIKAAEYVLRYRLVAPNLRLMPIQRDLKHFSQEELRWFLYGN